MRLLNYDQGEGSLQMSNFSGQTVPPYAILSHVWGKSEVQYSDIADGTYKEKDGYRKLKFCAEQAAKDNLQYFWVDTCCIDKWNLDELSRSINSMFFWYQNSAKCYVFLPDVWLGTPDTALNTTGVPLHTRDNPLPTTDTSSYLIPGRARDGWKKAFRKSKWFTRGWTLQELIAPSVVEFFSSEGERIGERKSLGHLIHEITNIPVDVFRNHPLNTFTISDRLQWAEHRETTLAEDKVYCLLGLLNIVMPTSYGEGEEVARRRLQVHIETSTNSPSMIPFGRNDRFTGWEKELVELETWLSMGETKNSEDMRPTSIAILGPPGTGKSQLALEFAYRAKNKSFNSVFWVDASSKDGLYRSYSDVARTLKVPHWDNVNTDVVKLVNRTLTSESASRSLLIFDNADNDDLGFGAASLSSHIPLSTNCSILITTTNEDVSKILAPEGVMNLGRMTPGTVQKMFENYLSSSLSSMEQVESKYLIQELSYLPLALVQAAAYIRLNGITPQDYRKRLAELHLSGSSKDNQYASDPITRTLLLSIHQIGHQNPLALDILALVACLGQRDIPIEILELPNQSLGIEETIEVLDEYALITRRQFESAIDVHQLVHSALQQRLRDLAALALEDWRQSALGQLRAAFPHGDQGGRHKWRRLLPHAKHAISLGTSTLINEMIEKDLMWDCVRAFVSDGRYGEAEEYIVRIKKTLEANFGTEYLQRLVCATELAAILRGQGRFQEAEELDVQSLETSKNMFGPDSEPTVDIFQNLAITYREQGQWEKAGKLAVQVLESRIRAFGSEHLLTLQAMSSLAMTYRAQGRYTEAEMISASILETRRRVLGGEHIKTLHSILDVAEIYVKQGRREDAERLLLELQETSQRILGDGHPLMLTTMSFLAYIIKTRGHWEKAERLELQVVEGNTRLYGGDSLHTARSLGSLAVTYKWQEKLHKAKEVEVGIVERFKKMLGLEHPDTLSGILRLAETLRLLGELKEAKELGVHVLETSKRVRGYEHPETLFIMYELALTFKAQGCAGKAYRLMGNCYNRRVLILGHKHPSALFSLEKLIEWKLEDLNFADMIADVD
ncbi:unnamed protein product [Periconia digitata]|uniref:AAA+ ATPase domain-containing protein n=1 Tax=Periconia digitata TaxID=1303443 RepID=A0A9W4XYX8_9PLEO|nr:unnamed protein product [Periconia digitata]